MDSVEDLTGRERQSVPAELARPMVLTTASASRESLEKDRSNGCASYGELLWLGLSRCV